MASTSTVDDERRSRRRTLVWVASIATQMASCSSPPPAPPKPPPRPTLLAAAIRTSNSVNPDARARPSPLRIRVYELKSSAAFGGADFLSLFEHDQATLGAEMGAREEFVLQPGETRPWEKALDGDVRFVGVVAVFRDIERASWKAIVPVKPNSVNAVSVLADGITLTVDAVVR